MFSSMNITYIKWIGKRLGPIRDDLESLVGVIGSVCRVIGASKAA